MAWWRAAMLGVAFTAATAGAATAQTVSVTLDAIYETPRPVYAAPPAVYATPEITFAMPAGSATAERSAAPPSHPKPQRGFAASSLYGEVVGRGAYPFLAASRCVTDLGYGRWEACD